MLVQSTTKNSNVEHSTSSTSKARSLLEVIIVWFVIFYIAMYSLLLLVYGTVDPTPLPIEAPYIVAMLWFVIPVIMIFGFRRRSKEYGLSVEKTPQSINLALNAYPYYILSIVGLMIAMIMGWSYLEPEGALVTTAFFVVSLILIVRMINKKYSNFQEIQISKKKYHTNLLVILILLALPILLGLALGKLSIQIISTVIWQFIFSGFGEEIFFRGYIQSRLNQSFGRPFEWKGIRFGWGLIISAAAFGVTHMLNTANIWFGDFNLAWWWGTFTFVGGLLFGLLREKTQSIVAPGVLHGLDAVGEALVLLI